MHFLGHNFEGNKKILSWGMNYDLIDLGPKSRHSTHSKQTKPTSFLSPPGKQNPISFFIFFHIRSKFSRSPVSLCSFSLLSIFFLHFYIYIFFLVNNLFLLSHSVNLSFFYLIKGSFSEKDLILFVCLFVCSLLISRQSRRRRIDLEGNHG